MYYIAINNKGDYIELRRCRTYEDAVAYIKQVVSDQEWIDEEWEITEAFDL